MSDRYTSDFNEIQKRVRVLVEAEENWLRSLGATDEDVEELVFKVMVAEKITDQIRAELGPDRYRKSIRKPRR